jgi:hypothetical protein
MHSTPTRRQPSITVTFRSVHPSEEFVREVQRAAGAIAGLAVLHVVIAEGANSFVVTAEMHADRAELRYVARHEDARTAVRLALGQVAQTRLHASMPEKAAGCG